MEISFASGKLTNPPGCVQEAIVRHIAVIALFLLCLASPAMAGECVCGDKADAANQGFDAFVVSDGGNSIEGRDAEICRACCDLCLCCSGTPEATRRIPLAAVSGTSSVHAAPAPEREQPKAFLATEPQKKICGERCPSRPNLNVPTRPNLSIWRL